MSGYCGNYTKHQFVFVLSNITVPVKTTSAPKQHTKLLYQESLEGSLLVEQSIDEGVTLQWTQTSKESLVLLKKITKKEANITGVYQPSDTQQCKQIHEDVVVGIEPLQDNLGSGNAGCKQDGMMTAQDSDGINSTTDCRRDKTIKNCAGLAQESGTSTELNTNRLKKDNQALERNDDSRNEHRGLKPQPCELPSKVRAVENASKNIPRRDMSSLSEKDVCGSVGGLQTSQGSTKDCHGRAKEELNPCAGHNFRKTKNVCYIEAPFLNPRLFERSCSNNSSLLSGTSVQLLNSTNYVVAVVLPLLAYVYHHTSEDWSALLFPCPIKCCCITNGKCRGSPLNNTHDLVPRTSSAFKMAA